ncbi:MAG: FAD-dependent oxidoreductase, partial [Candidatus Thermoplasmatota archaeon]|nr:FAD-dependent oxidoreductase [Candidatus Thermoplasmatota archaeon]
MKPWDVAIIGGGILGTSIAYWFSTRYDARIAVIEQETDVAKHASGRNTGVIHRPFYLHPEKGRLFARSSLLSYDLWRRYAEERGLPWKEVGTLKLALRENEVNQLETYMRWAEENGMEEGEVELLDAEQVGNLEPHVKCVAALHVKKETAVDFGAFTRELRKDVEANGVRFLLKRRVLSLSSNDEGVEMDVAGSREPHQAKYVINCAGGDAMDLAHSLGAGLEYTDLHFRGE